MRWNRRASDGPPTGATRSPKPTPRWHVYIDGSAGSLILQMLAAGLFALGATLRVVRESVKRFFHGRLSHRNREQ